MIEVITNGWPISLWYNVIEWCAETFGYDTYGIEWFWQDDYSIYLSEEAALLMALRWT